MHERIQVNTQENQTDVPELKVSGVKASGNLPAQDTLAETLSALMDGEAGDLELRRLLRAVNGQAGATDDVDALLSRWQRYHLVQASLHNEQGPQIRTNLLPGIRARLDAEGAAHPQRAGLAFRAPGVLGRMAQGAVAASVAALVLFGATQVDQHLRGDSPGGPAASGALVAGANETPLLPELGGEYNPSSLTRTVSMGAAERDRIQRAVQQFSGQAPAVLFNEVYTFPVQTGTGDQQSAAGQ